VKLKMKKSFIPAVKKEFQEYYLTSSLLFMKRGFAVTICLFVFFALATQILFPHSPSKTYFLRFGAIIPIIAISLIAVYIRSLKKYLHSTLTIFAFLSSFAVFFVGAFSDIHDIGYNYFFTWVMLVLIGTYTFYRIRLFYCFAAGAVIVLSFVLATIVNHNFSEDPLDFTNKLFFIMGISSVGYFVALSSQRLVYNNFLHKKELGEYNEKLENEVRERKITEAALKEAQLHYLNLLDSIPDMIYVIDDKLRFVLTNQSIKKAHRRLSLEENVIGKKITDIYKFGNVKRLNEIENVFATGKEIINEGMQVINGSTYNVETRIIPIFSREKVVRVIVIIRDISKKMEVEELKQRNLEQKEVLLREIHHRVKNNLAIVISLLDMQIRKNPNPAFIKIARDIEFRIRSMALMHEHLYKSDELDRVSFHHYLSSLATTVTRTYNGVHIDLNCNLEHVDVRIEIAMPLGMIVNEILTNACKHAFHKRQHGKLSIDLREEDQDACLFRLTIRDDGTGLPEGFSIQEQSSMGMFIIRLLSEQINAKLLVEIDHGTSFTLLFKGIRPDKQQ
jgi:PAS domain S-box-containing protein